MHRTPFIVLAMLASAPALIAEFYVVPSKKKAGSNGRHRAAVTFSSGRTVVGEVWLQKGTQFKANLHEGARIHDVKYKKDAKTFGFVKKFGFDQLRELEYVAIKEEMWRQWTWPKRGVEAKNEFGLPYPLRHLNGKITFTSGEMNTATMDTAIIYIRPDNGKTEKHIVYKLKQRGEPGQAMEDLIYIRRIRLLDQKETAAAPVTAELVFHGMKVTQDDEVALLRAVNLDRIIATWDEQRGCFTATGLRGQDVYVGVRQGDTYYIGWQDEADEEMRKIADKGIQEWPDFYDRNTLLGVRVSPNDKQIHCLLRLERPPYDEMPSRPDRVLPNHPTAKRISATRYLKFGIWRMDVDRDSGKMFLTGRGRHFRLVANEKKSVPGFKVVPTLWGSRWEGDKLHIGEPEQRH